MVRCTSTRTHISVESAQFAGKFTIRTEDRVNGLYLVFACASQSALCFTKLCRTAGSEPLVRCVSAF